MASTNRSQIVQALDEEIGQLQRVRNSFASSTGQPLMTITVGASAMQQPSVGRRVVHRASSRRRTSARSQSTQTQPQVVGQQTQQAKPHRRVSASTRRKLQAAAKARWAARKGQQQAA